MAIGEAGSITTNSPVENGLITVTLTEPLTNPVFAFTATNNGGNAFTLRLVDQTLDADGNTTAFSFIIEEWEYLDGPHPATETINWLAIEEGVHTLPDGRIIEAGTTSTSSAGSSETFSGGFTTPPVVLTSVMSNNDTTTVDSDPSNITATGFNLSLQEEEAEDDNHAAETIGWIAIQAGGTATSGTANTHGGLDESPDTFGLGDTFNNAVVLGETQTLNGSDPANVMLGSQTNSAASMYLQEEQSANDEISHVDETVGIVAFENGLIPCFVAGTLIQTTLGPRPVETLQPGDRLQVLDGGTSTLKLVLRRHLTQAELLAYPNLRPIRICAGALGNSLPLRDLLVSPQHRMLVLSRVAKRMLGVSDVLVAAKRLCVQPGIREETEATSVTYVHLVTEKHQVVYAEGAPSETLYAGPGALASLPAETREEILTLFPECRIPGMLPCPARLIPAGRLQKSLMRRIAKNQKPVLEATGMARLPANLRVKSA